MCTPQTKNNLSFHNTIACRGFCGRCGKDHVLAASHALEAAHKLMNYLEMRERIDYTQKQEKADPRFSTQPLFGSARGHMFGVLTYQQKNGAMAALYAFSGQYNGVWLVPGWAPPLFEVETFQALNTPQERKIKEIGRIIAETTSSDKIGALKKERKHLSQKLMKDIHALYCMTNFKGEKRPLSSFFTNKNGIPTGAGDCCAPKLLHYAARKNIHPLGLAEFYWGRENRSRTRQHGQFYGPCQDKCGPILGFLLCGLSATSSETYHENCV